MGSWFDNTRGPVRLRPPGAAHRAAARRPSPVTTAAGGRTAKVAVLLATVLVVTMTAAAVAGAPALADVAGADPPDVVLQEDGTLVFGGDLATDCPSFAGGVEQGELYGADDPEQARSALELCEEAGLLDSGGGAPGASEANGEGGRLPDTGGPDLPALLVVAILVVAASGLLARKVAAG